MVLSLLATGAAAAETQPEGAADAEARVRQARAAAGGSTDAFLRALAKDPLNLAAGRAVFNAHCAVCHLENLRGKTANPAVIGSDLTDAVWDHGGTPGDILTTIMHGLIDRGMPPWKDVLGEEKMDLVVAYVLSHQPPSTSQLFDTNAAHTARLREWLAESDEMPLPAPHELPRLAYLPLRLPDGELLEAIGLLHADGTMLVYDQAALALHSAWADVVLRRERGALRGFRLEGQRQALFRERPWSVRLREGASRQELRPLSLREVIRSRDGIRIRTRAELDHGREVIVEESLQLAQVDGEGVLRRTLALEGVPTGIEVEFASGQSGESPAVPPPPAPAPTPRPRVGDAVDATGAGAAVGSPVWRAEWVHRLGPPPVSVRRRGVIPAPIAREDPYGGSRERPGYRAVQPPLPRLPSAEDRVMPLALATDHGSGTLYVASGKSGEIFALRTDPDPGGAVRWRDFAVTHFQDVLAMAWDDDALLVQHRRNLTRVRDTDGDGVADRFERLLSFPQQLDPKAYDWGYGMVKDRSGGYLLSFAGHAPASQGIVGAGSAIRLRPGAQGWTVEEVAFGLRNPVGWTPGPGGDIFFTDNQGNWMASNRLSELVPDRFYGFPNPKQPEHRAKPQGPTAVWVPYGWAKSINGVTYDATGGKFGPFAGHFFLAEVMEGGAIIRAHVEKVKGQYQGACFPFWDRGLLGPVAMTFDPAGRLWVGSLTEPAWLRQPDRGALYAIEYTGDVPFEIESIHALPAGFRVRFTLPPARRALEAISYRIEHYRYDYSATYGSKEFDRTAVPVEGVALQPDGRTVDLALPPLVRGRIYRFDLDAGLTSQRGQNLVNGRAAYTLNEIPD